MFMQGIYKVYPLEMPQEMAAKVFTKVTQMRSLWSSFSIQKGEKNFERHDRKALEHHPEELEGHRKGHQPLPHGCGVGLSRWILLRILP